MQFIGIKLTTKQVVPPHVVQSGSGGWVLLLAAVNRLSAFAVVIVPGFILGAIFLFRRRVIELGD